MDTIPYPICNPTNVWHKIKYSVLHLYDLKCQKLLVTFFHSSWSKLIISIIITYLDLV